MVKHTSLCGLGQTAPNPVLSTLRYFRNEYVALLAMRPPRRSRRRRDDRQVVPAEDRGVDSCSQTVKAVIMAAVKTLTIDGKLISARGDQTILEAAAGGGHLDPDAVPPRRASRDVGACRLCLVEVGGSRQAAAGLHHRRSSRRWRSRPTPSGCATTAG